MTATFSRNTWQTTSLQIKHFTTAHSKFSHQDQTKLNQKEVIWKVNFTNIQEMKHSKTIEQRISKEQFYTDNSTSQSEQHQASKVGLYIKHKISPLVYETRVNVTAIATIIQVTNDSKRTEFASWHEECQTGVTTPMTIMKCWQLDIQVTQGSCHTSHSCSQNI